MRIDGWHVDGFGVLKDFDQDGLEAGVTVLLGENEAGKSTLLAFLRAMLFGTAASGSKDWSYEPLRGGRHGGELRLRDGEDQLWVVERYADVKKKTAKIRLPDGSEGDADDLTGLLGAVDARLFRAVFAFGLEELQQFESLTGKGVGERIFDVGISGAGTSAREVMRRFGLRQDALLKRWSSKAKINDVVKELTLVEAEERAARALAGQHERLRRDEEHQKRSAADLQADSERLQRQKTETEALIELRPQWDKVEEMRGELAGLPETSDGSLPDRAAGLVTDLAAQRVREERLSEFETTRAGESASVDAALGRLGDGWEIERVRTFDASVEVEDAVRTWQTDLDGAEDSLRQAQQKQVTAAEESTRLRALADRVRGELPAAEPPALEEIVRREALLRCLRDDAARCETLRLKAEHELPQGVPSRAWIVYVLAALAGVGAAASWVAGYAQLGVGLLVAAVLLAVAGALTPGRRAKEPGDPGERPGVIDELRASMRGSAATLGLPEEPSTDDMAACEASLGTERSRRSAWDNAQQRVRDAEVQAEEARRLADGAVTLERKAQESSAQLMSGWSEWLTHRGLTGLSPAGVLDVLKQVERASSADGRRTTAADDIQAIEEQAALWEESARRVLAGAGRPSEGLATEALRTAFEKLNEDLERRAVLTDALSSTERAVTVRLAACEDPVAAEGELASGDIGVWQDKVDRLGEDLARRRSDRDAAIQAATTALREREAIERSADIPRLQEQRESLLAEMAAHVHEYRVVSTANALVAATLKTFVRDRQPAVFASASQAFATVTHGRYTEVQQDEEVGLDSVAVLNREGVQLRPDMLSKGTQQQLYLSIRLALVSEFGRRTPLPLIMDDCLVNFDPQRAAAVAGLLAERSAEGQCLLFTCHPETAELMAGQTVGPVRVIEMNAR